MNKQKILDFLNELTELSKKYDLYIGGCGCCGSPYIYTSDGDYVLNDLEFRCEQYKGE